MPSEIVALDGHIIDSLILAKILDLVVAGDGDYRILEVDIGRTAADPSRARIEISAATDEALDRMITTLRAHGARPLDDVDAATAEAEADGVLPAGFYATTNLATEVRVGGTWVPVARPEMDCAVVLDPGEPRTVPMHRVRRGDTVVIGNTGVRVQSPPRPAATAGFGFMDSEVSSEKPKGALVARVAERLRAARSDGSRILAVCGPAVIHTGAGPDLARLVRHGWVDVLFAGNGFATHDIESNVLGTSLGVPLDDSPNHAGEAGGTGHANHLRVINEVRRHGSIAAAVAGGYVAGGVMYECERAGVPYVLAGSVRDDGPLPDVITDVVAAADAMRTQVAGVGVALMLASTLHAIATGNLLPAEVETYCVDINQSVATKLTDRGSHQALGIVTDVGLFVRSLADHLCP